MSATKDRRAASRKQKGNPLETARERTVSAYEAARERTSDVTRQVTTQMAVYPVGAVIGGLALGAVLGVILPRTRRETELLGDTGRRLSEAAQKKVVAGRDQIEQLTGKMVTKVGKAVAEAVGAKD